MITDILGYLAGFLATIVMIPQSYKIIKTKKSDDISLEFLYIGQLSSITWVAYGIFLDSYPIIICDAIIIIIQTVTIYYTKKYRKKKIKIDDTQTDNTTPEDIVVEQEI